MAAHQQGKFWEFHSKLFESYNALNETKIEEIATELNLNMEKFKSDQQTPAVKNIILRDLQNGRSAGVRGTPALFVNGKQVKNRSFDNLSRMIEKELEKKPNR